MYKTLHRLTQGVALVTVLLGGAASHAAECDASAGRQMFEAKCSACHALTQTRVGPKLAGVVGRPIGSVPGFTYSSDLAQANNTWSTEQLDEFLSAPAKKSPRPPWRSGGCAKPRIDKPCCVSSSNSTDCPIQGNTAVQKQ
ncbi:Cytochrome c2 [compost metagenome]